MKKFDNIMIASDLDGTFFSSERREVARNIEKIRYFTDNGGLFTFSTGRIYPHVLSCAPNSPSYVNCPIVSCNGMCLYDISEGRALKEHFSDSDLIADVTNFVYERYPSIGFRGVGRDGIITFQPENRFIKGEMELKIAPTFIVPRENWRGEKFHKLTLRDKPDVLARVKEEIAERFPNKFNLCYSEPTVFEIQPFGVSKAVMLSELRDMVSEGGVRRTLYAVGDYGNDIEMLKMADVAVCPSNALDEIKEICDLCLCENNQGVIADLIEYIENKI